MRKDLQESFSRGVNNIQQGQPFSVLSAKVLDTMHQTAPKTKNVLFVVKLIHTRTAQINKKGSQSAQIVGGPHVASNRGCPAYKDKAFRQHVV